MDKKTISHYGVARRSGRYPWGSGEDPQQRNKSFLGYVDDLKKKGMSDVKIAEGMGITTTQLRIKRSLAKTEIKKADQAMAWKLKEKGMSNVEIGKRMGGRNESSVRSLLNEGVKERTNITETTAKMLKESVAKKEYVDIGVGTEHHIGVSRTRLKTAVGMLQAEGYAVSTIQVQQLGTGKKTNVMVLSKPKKKDAIEVHKLKNDGLDDAEIAKKMGVDEFTVKKLQKEVYSDVFKNRDKIKTITDYSEDGGRSFLGLEPIRSVSSKSVMVRMGKDGGGDKDGVIELRRGVPELSLGGKRYAQVRIGVDGTHFMKGMAMYADDMPKGVNIIYNSNKNYPDKHDHFKEMKDDPDNPFGATVRQKHYIDDKGKKQLSSLNIVGSKEKEGSGEEGSWETWSKNLSSQFLSKQAPSLAKKQLDLVYEDKKKQYDEIMQLTNPTVRKKLLEEFADGTDSAAVHLKAAAMPRQMSHVILPLTKIKEDEIYAPNYRDGEKVVLVRYPHGGIFEIPELTVNNRNKSGRSILGDVKDAVGIHPKVANKLSGADFDGDTVIVIPNNNKAIKTAPSLKGLADFDTKAAYPPYHGMQTIDGGIYNEKTRKAEFPPGKKASNRTMGIKMGDVSNLITDMTIKGADNDEIARAVRHSMVVIDSPKHSLDYKRSYVENGIAALKQKYQGGSNRGASTLISRASSEIRVDARKEGMLVKDPVTGKTKRMYVDPKTGKKLYEYTGETYIKNGKPVKSTVSSTKMAEVDDAFELSSGKTLIETVYATHANKLKGLANDARKAALKTPRLVSSPSAKNAYGNEVASLKAKLNLALKNKPLERQAQLLANSVVAAKKKDNPDMDGADLKKIKNQALTEARLRTGAKKQLIDITDKEWEAIQSGAISNNALTQILNNTDMDRVKQLATPRTTTKMSTTQVTRAKAMLANGATRADIADALGISRSMLSKSLR